MDVPPTRRTDFSLYSPENNCHTWKRVRDGDFVWREFGFLNNECGINVSNNVTPFLHQLHLKCVTILTRIDRRIIPSIMLTASFMKMSDDAPFHLGSLSGKICPMSGNPRAPSTASTTQCNSTSPIVSHPSHICAVHTLHTIRMRLTSFGVWNIDATDDEGIAFCQTMQIESMSNLTFRMLFVEKKSEISHSVWQIGCKELP